MGSNDLPHFGVAKHVHDNIFMCVMKMSKKSSFSFKRGERLAIAFIQ